MANPTNNLVETLVDAQKSAVDTLTENTRKFTNGNSVVNEQLQKGSDWYKNWLDNQKNVFSNTTEKLAHTGETIKDSTEKTGEFYQNWFNTQMGWAKQLWEMNLNFLQNTTQQQQATASNPFSQFNGMMSNWMNGMNTANPMTTATNWMTQMMQHNPFTNMNVKNMTDTWTNFFGQYQNMLTGAFGDLQKNMQNGTATDAYRNMVNAGEGFTRFYQLWMPMWKSLQDNTFSMDLYKQMMNPSMYQDMMDKFFGFLPEQSRAYFQQLTSMMTEGMKQNAGTALNGYHQMRQAMAPMMQPFTGSELFGNMLTTYQNWYQQVQDGISPITRMMTQNQYTRTAAEWSDIANRLVVYQIRNAEMQYMIYNQGVQVMDKLAETTLTKMQNGEQPKSMMALYQEWLNLSDSVFVKLFESDEYSRIMAETSAMQLKLKKDIELQMEKMFSGVPVATRSEMEEMYKTIYELRREVRQLEKTVEMNATAEHTTTANRNTTSNPTATVANTTAAATEATDNTAKTKNNTTNNNTNGNANGRKA